MDPRIPYTTTANGEVVTMNRTFPDLVTAKNTVDQIIKKRELLAGRTLTGVELRSGLLRQPLTGREAIGDEQWRPVVTGADAEPANPFKRELAERNAAERFDKLHTRTKLLIASAAKWDSDRQIAEQQAAHDADPKRQKLVAASEAQLEHHLFSIDSTSADVAAARRALRQAREGDTGPAAEMLKAGAARINEAGAVRQASLSAKIDELKSYQVEAVDDDESAPAPAPAPATTGQYFHDTEADKQARESMYTNAWGPDRTKWPVEAQ